MIPIPALVLCAIFLVLSAFHISWLFGGDRDIGKAVPTKDGEPLFTPRKASTLMVALALAGGAAISIWRGLEPEVGPIWIPRVGTWVLVVVFALRATGDFRYVGFFKRVRDTEFARNDTLLFSPLCLCISALAVWLALGY